ncbi:hypothetical protein DM02DRAFT_397397 [Periconia macrospinosa]|uniref:Uncharacterized protein n=1 Tax=Periconia macrospinosa TaxID=97972 RepID=A0A2V1D0U3_9PLEO|nr:hypothetical protein DM02DRAFT_397397 [Periconia macrospinosa]
MYTCITHCTTYLPPRARALCNTLLVHKHSSYLPVVHIIKRKEVTRARAPSPNNPHLRTYVESIYVQLCIHFTDHPSIHPPPPPPPFPRVCVRACVRAPARARVYVCVCIMSLSLSLSLLSGR